MPVPGARARIATRSCQAGFEVRLPEFLARTAFRTSNQDRSLLTEYRNDFRISRTVVLARRWNGEGVLPTLSGPLTFSRCGGMKPGRCIDPGSAPFDPSAP